MYFTLLTLISFLSIKFHLFYFVVIVYCYQTIKHFLKLWSMNCNQLRYKSNSLIGDKFSFYKCVFSSSEAWIVCIKEIKLKICPGAVLYPTYNYSIFKFRLEDYFLQRPMICMISHGMTVSEKTMEMWIAGIYQI